MTQEYSDEITFNLISSKQNYVGDFSSKKTNRCILPGNFSQWRTLCRKNRQDIICLLILI